MTSLIYGYHEAAIGRWYLGQWMSEGEMPKRTNTSGVKRPDDVSDEFPGGKIKLLTKLLGPTADGEAARIWIEGDKTSLEYLGKMILAQADFPLDCQYGISPRSAGRAFFKRGAKIGIVIHRLPCMNVVPNMRRLHKQARSPVRRHSTSTPRE